MKELLLGISSSQGAYEAGVSRHSLSRNSEYRNNRKI